MKKDAIKNIYFTFWFSSDYVLALDLYSFQFLLSGLHAAQIELWT